MGYRWARDKRDKLVPGWNAGWVVIGNVMGGDPIIAAPREHGRDVPLRASKGESMNVPATLTTRTDDDVHVM